MKQAVAITEDLPTTAVSIELLQASPTNPRKQRPADRAAFDSLVDSIRRHGILVPLLVRPLHGNGDHAGGQEDRFEIVDGERRYLAAKKAAIGQVPVRARVMTVAEASDIQVIANLQRQDIHPLDEARGFEQLITAEATKGGRDVIAAIATRVGKEQSYVARRLQLTHLIAPAAALFSDDVITLEHALLLCRLGGEDQERHLQWSLDQNYRRRDLLEDTITEARKRLAEKHTGYTWEPASAKQLKAHIEDGLTLKLSHAPWDLKDAKLVPEAGACTECPKQTATNQALFADFEVAGATCMDRYCYQTKQEAFVELAVAKEKARQETKGKMLVLKLSYKASTAPPKYLPAEDGKVKVPNPGQIFKAGQWVDAKQGSCSGVLPGITVDTQDTRYYAGAPVGGKPGVRKLVCVAPNCKVHRKAYNRNLPKAAAPHDYQAEARARAERQAAERPLRMKLGAMILANVRGMGPAEIRFLVQQAHQNEFNFGHAACALIASQLDLPKAGTPGVLECMVQLDPKGPLYAKCVIAACLDEELAPNLWDAGALTQSRQIMRKYCRHFNVNPDPVIEAHTRELAKPGTAAATRGTCRYCGCTMTTPCSPPCAWADSTETLCDAPACIAKANSEAIARVKKATAKRKAGKKAR